jgi:hypothetical protein
MTPEARRALQVLASALPEGGAVPVPREWLLELLCGAGPSPRMADEADLTAVLVAARFGRHASTVRLWLERGMFPGAYKLRGRDWRVPPSSLAAFEERERDRKPTSQRRSCGKLANLADWRLASWPVLHPIGAPYDPPQTAEPHLLA